MLAALAENDRVDLWREAPVARRGRLIDSALRTVASHSLLTLLAIELGGPDVHVTPYHSYSLHQVRDRDGESVLIRPGRASRRHWSLFKGAIEELEALLSRPDVKEREIEALLTKNPLFLRGLAYGEVYHQVVLPRPGAEDLRPDIIAQPVGGEWADIIDLKMPSQPLLVGGPNRARLAAAIHEAAAQLREYSAYFDDAEMAKRVQERYGFRCHRPKLVVIVGRDPTRYMPEQRRRALTSSPGLEILTYDELLRAARRTLLL